MESTPDAWATMLQSAKCGATVNWTNTVCSQCAVKDEKQTFEMDLSSRLGYPSVIVIGLLFESK